MHSLKFDIQIHYLLSNTLHFKRFLAVALFGMALLGHNASAGGKDDTGKMNEALTEVSKRESTKALIVLGDNVSFNWHFVREADELRRYLEHLGLGATPVRASSIGELVREVDGTYDLIILMGHGNRFMITLGGFSNLRDMLLQLALLFHNHLRPDGFAIMNSCGGTIEGIPSWMPSLGDMIARGLSERQRVFVPSRIVIGILPTASGISFVGRGGRDADRVTVREFRGAPRADSAAASTSTPSSAAATSLGAYAPSPTFPFGSISSSSRVLMSIILILLWVQPVS